MWLRRAPSVSCLRSSVYRLLSHLQQEERAMVVALAAGLESERGGGEEGEGGDEEEGG